MEAGKSNPWRAVALTFMALAAGLLAWQATGESRRNKAERERSAKYQRAADRSVAQQKANAPIAPRVIAVGPHELMVVDVQSVGLVGLETRRCFVWRDATYKTASLACDKDDTLVLDGQ